MIHSKITNRCQIRAITNFHQKRTQCFRDLKDKKIRVIYNPEFPDTSRFHLGRGCHPILSYVVEKRVTGDILSHLSRIISDECHVMPWKLLIYLKCPKHMRRLVALYFQVNKNRLQMNFTNHILRGLYVELKVCNIVLSHKL